MIDRYAGYEADRIDDEFQNTEDQESFANSVITDTEQLEEILLVYEPEIADQLARAMRSIDSACIGNKISIDAVLESVSRIQRILLDAVKDSL